MATRAPPLLLDLWRRPELRSIGAVAVASAALLALLRLGEVFVAGRIGAIDKALLLSLRVPADLSSPLGPHWFHGVVRDITALGGHLVLLALAGGAAVFFALRGKLRAGAVLILATGSGAIVNHLLKVFFERPRPELVPHLVPVFSLSFPSGHAMLSAVVYLTLAGLLARLERGRLARLYLLAGGILVTILVGASRVYLGVHWPSDVLAGWAVGATWALVWLLLVQGLSAAPSREPCR